MSYKLLCTLLILTPSIACADQYRFSAFTTNKQNLPLRTFLTLPQECYTSVSGSFFPLRLLKSKQPYTPNTPSSFLSHLIHEQKGLLSLNIGYSLDKQNALELKIASSLAPSNLILSPVYKCNHLYRIDKLVISAKGGLLIPIAWEAENDNISKVTVFPSDSLSSAGVSRGRKSQYKESNSGRKRHQSKNIWVRSRSKVSQKGRSRSRPRVTNNSSDDESYTTKNKRTLLSTHDTPTHSSIRYQRHNTFGFTASISGCYSINPTVYIEGSATFDRLPLESNFKNHSNLRLPFGIVGSVQIGLHINLA